MNRGNNVFALSSVAHKQKDSPHDSSGEKSLVFQTPPFKRKKSSGEEYSDSRSPSRTKSRRNPRGASNEYMGRGATKRTHSSQKALSSAQNELLILDKKRTRPQQSSNAHSNASLSLKAHSPDIRATNGKPEAPVPIMKALEVLKLDQKQFRLGLEAQDAKKVKIKEKITF